MKHILLVVVLGMALTTTTARAAKVVIEPAQAVALSIRFPDYYLPLFCTAYKIYMLVGLIQHQ